MMTGSSTDEIGLGSGWIFIITTWGLIGGIYGAIIGTMQWLVLRRYLAHSGWWVLVTAGSLALLFVVDVTIMISVSGTLNQATFGKIIEGSWPNGLFFVILWPIISFFTETAELTFVVAIFFNLRSSRRAKKLCFSFLTASLAAMEWLKGRRCSGFFA